ncbi:MAG: hypothetical protein ACOCUU_02025 [Nanoarchaeota archaeon]
MGWYGIFLLKKLKIAFVLRKVDEASFEENSSDLDRFFDKYNSLREDMERIQISSENEKDFSAKTTAKMFNIIDEFGKFPDIPLTFFLLYFLQKFNFKVDYFSEDKINLDELEKKGWRIISNEDI